MKRTSRVPNPGSRSLLSDNRRSRARLDRAYQAACAADLELSSARDDWDLRHGRAQLRFGRPLPNDPLLLDVLDLIDVLPGDVWRWRGMLNNRALPSIRVREYGADGSVVVGERSVTRFLADRLGGPPGYTSDSGMLFPAEGVSTLDVNPEHRVMRGERKPQGNPARFAGAGDELALLADVLG